METLKVAFDTLIVGALALPWLAVLVRMYLPATAGKPDEPLVLLPALPERARDAVFGVVILALGYFLGSAVSRISDDFFGDAELWHTLPTEPSIRVDVYYHEYCDVHSVIQAMGLPKELGGSRVAFCSQLGLRGADNAWRKSWSDVVLEFFRLQEGRLLLQGEEKTARLRELHNQIVVLRGATLNGIVLATLCLFGFFVSFSRGGRSWRNLLSTHLAATALVVYGGYCLWSHFHRLSLDYYDPYRDPPLAEGVMILVGIAGLLARTRTDGRWKYVLGFGLSFAITLIAYGGWWWTEVMYNQSVIHGYETIL